MRHLLPLLTLLGMLTDCYIYRPLGTTELTAGSRVAAELTDRGSDTLSRDVGPGVTTLRGEVVSAADAEVVLSLISVTDRSGRDQSWKREHVRVPRMAVQDFQRREFSLGRSLLLGAAFVGGSVLAVEAFQGGVIGGGSQRSGGGGGQK